MKGKSNFKRMGMPCTGRLLGLFDMGRPMCHMQAAGGILKEGNCNCKRTEQTRDEPSSSSLGFGLLPLIPIC
jgi:hypothetical protein